MASFHGFTVNYSFGSLTAISDATGNLVESLSYDPWGRRRNPNNWNDYNVTSTMFDRGFTGHEHLPQFGLINMNGKVYDPFLARFLSPDPRVSNPENGQNFNRYSYALNNPFKYTDPDGEHPLIIAAALIGGGFNMISNWQNISKNPWSAIGYFASGAAGGIVAIAQPALGGTIAATGNVATDLAFGNIPDFKKPMDVIQYVGFKALDGLAAASAPKIARSVLNASWLSRNSYKMGGVQYELLAESADEIAFTANISSEVTVLAQKTYTFDGVANSALKIGKNVIAGADEIGNAAKGMPQYTKSSLSLGREMHTAFKAGLADDIVTFKEFTKIKGIRPDFVDFSTKTIYELKPFNPRQIQLGTKQLNNYKLLFEQRYGGTWNTVLDLY